ncbi:MAG: type II secretion system protein [Candidatus Omnitrophota bacterium]
MLKNKLKIFNAAPRRVVKQRSFLTAFTLIEAIMVIVIVAILAVLAVPRFETFYFIKLNGAVKKVVADIRYIQQLAVSEHTDTKLVFNTVTESYSAQKFNPAAGGWVNITDPFTRANLSVNFTTDPQYKGLNISTTNLLSNTLRFDWQGNPQEGTDAAPVNLTVERRVTFIYINSSNNLSIYVTPNTGRVRVE